MLAGSCETCRPSLPATALFGSAAEPARGEDRFAMGLFSGLPARPFRFLGGPGLTFGLQCCGARAAASASATARSAAARSFRASASAFRAAIRRLRAATIACRASRRSAPSGLAAATLARCSCACLASCAARSRSTMLGTADLAIWLFWAHPSSLSGRCLSGVNHLVTLG
jgi:hypothetical protein